MWDWENFELVRANAKLVWTLTSAANIYLVISEGNYSTALRVGKPQYLYSVKARRATMDKFKDV